MTDGARARRTRRRLAVAALACAALPVLLALAFSSETLRRSMDPADAPLGLPEKVVGGYWMKWSDSDSQPLATVPLAYNTIYLAFAQGSEGTGRVTFGQGVQSEDSFREDVDEVRARGQRVLLSLGGEGGTIDLSSSNRREELVDSVLDLHEDFPFDGVDWDVEGQELHVENMAWASRRLKQVLGDAFAITMAPQGHVDEYRELAEALGNDLDFTAIQYYDYAEDTQQDRIASVRRRTRQLIEEHGLSPSQIGIGMRVHDDEGRYVRDGTPSKWFSLRGARQAWTVLEAEYPELRGVFLWEIAADSQLGGRWVKDVAPHVS